jgi:hypothetical protein
MRQRRCTHSRERPKPFANLPDHRQQKMTFSQSCFTSLLDDKIDRENIILYIEEEDNISRAILKIPLTETVRAGAICNKSEAEWAEGPRLLP